MAAIASSSEEPRWRFESVDLRAGLAFAGWRPERRPDVADDIDDRPCLFFGPPNFIGEPVGNVAFALAASRGSFHPGLTVGGREAAFNTAEEVAEFVRRAYISSAAGDGADGDGGGVEPPPIEPWDPPDVDDEGDGHFWDKDHAHGSLYVAAEAFVKLTKSNAAGSAAETEWASVHGERGVDPLALGAVRVLRELLRRHPIGRDAKSFLRWHADLRVLGRCIDRVGLWPAIFGGTYAMQVVRMIDAVRLPFPSADALAPIGKAWLLLMNGPLLDDDRLNDIDQYLFAHWPHIDPLSGSSSLGVEDPLDVLRMLPVPQQFGNSIGVSTFAAPDLLEKASLYHALNGFIACPAPTPELDVLLFSVACIITCNKHPLDFASGSGVFWHGRIRPPTPLQHAAIQEVVVSAVRWIQDHLPRLAFAPGYEALISSAKDIRYR